MRSRIIRIGNSWGIRIPKSLLEQTGILEDVELEVDKNKIIVRPVSNPREDWEEAFKSMAEKGDDTRIIDDESISHSWDDEEWKW